MKTINQYINEFVVKKHIKDEIDIEGLSDGPIEFRGIKISIQRNEQTRWEEFSEKNEMFELVTKILDYIEPNVIVSMDWYYGNHATLTMRKKGHRNIGWLSYDEEYDRLVFADWELTIELYSDKDGVEKIANEINKIGKS